MIADRTPSLREDSPRSRARLLRLVLWSVLTGLFLVSARAWTAEIAPDTPSAWHVYEVLHRTCIDCHGGHLAKPKGKLGYILDLRRLIDEGYIQPGDPGASDLLSAIVATDEEEKMPPPDSDGPKPSPEDIEVIRAWIAAGAGTGQAAVAAPTAAAESAPAARPLGQTLGRLHPLLVHFPIALLLGACAAEVLSRLLPRQAGSWQGMTRGSLWIAALGGIVAAAFGWLNAAHEGYASGEVDRHRWLGVATAGLTVVALVVSERVERVRRSRGLLLGVLIVAAVVVSLAGHTGGVLAYGKDYLGF